MQEGGDPIVTEPQAGGFDPGLTALIAAILTGSIGVKGFMAKSNRAEEELKQEAAAALSGAQAELVKEAEEVKARITKMNQSNIDLARKNTALQKEIDDLKSKYKMSVALTGPSLTFQKASVATLKNSVGPTIDALRALIEKNPNYKWMDYNQLTNLREALEYPSSSMGQLSRPSLTTFYEKRILPAAEKDKQTLGGKRRRGGANSYGTFAANLDDASVDTSDAGSVAPTTPRSEPEPPADVPSVPFFPPFEEFATLYEDVIVASTVSIRDQERSKTEKAIEEIKTKRAEKSAENAKAADIKKDETAVKSAKTLADKIRKAIENAEKELPTYHSKVGRNEELIARESALYTDLENAKKQNEDPLRLVKTEAEWTAIKDDSKRVLEEIPQKVKSYAKAVKEAQKAKPEPAAPAPAPAPAPEPPVEEITTVQSPLFLKQEADRKKQSFEEQKAEVQSEGPSRLTRKNKRKTFGGKLRKRTLKKRRGGK